MNNYYWKDIDSLLLELVQEGFVKLPSIKDFDLNYYSKKILIEMGQNTFSSLTPSHKEFLDEIDIYKKLAPKLYEIAVKKFNFNGNISDQYHIARNVEPGNSKEMYRAHFDSHLFTIVFPIKIPSSLTSSHTGDLMFSPKARRFPKNELNNFFGKLYFKQYASKKGLDRYKKKNNLIEESFQNLEPILFIGNTTLHTNYPVSLSCDSNRLTLLAHFFDPHPNGIGNILRKIRNR
jgi:hypothetical protein